MGERSKSFSRQCDPRAKEALKYGWKGAENETAAELLVKVQPQLD